MEKTLSETKEDLIRKTESYKHTIEEQITELRGDAAKLGKIALYAGGLILITYFLLRGTRKNKTQKLIEVGGQEYALATIKKKESFVATTIRKYMIIFLATLAKQRVASYLQKLNTKNNLEANSPKTPELQEKW